MIAGVRLKVCGITSLVDAEAADAVGADYLGFILHPASPRFVPLAQFAAMQARLPDRPKVAVMVTPDAAALSQAAATGFDFFQIHFPANEAKSAVAASAQLGHGRVWFAPRLAPGEQIDDELLSLADTWLLDTYRADGFGGSGRTGDWAGFRRYREKFVRQTWVLAGGLGPENIRAALDSTGARFVDVNSGVEQSPGLKDPAKLAALRRALQGEKAQ